jgi:DNA repair protein RadD
LNPGKANCLVLDFGGNVLRHGPVDAIRIQERSGGQGEAPAKECPSCHVVIAAGYAICPQCGFEFPPPERQKHEAKASEAGILSGQVTDTEFNVQDISYSVHTKRGAPPDAPRTMRVTYRLGLTYSVSEFICFEHTGYARQKAETWWQARSDEPVPDTAEAAVEIATQIGIASSEAVTVRNVTGEQFERIVAHRLGERLAPIGLSLSDDDIPF